MDGGDSLVDEKLACPLSKTNLFIFVVCIKFIFNALLVTTTTELLAELSLALLVVRATKRYRSVVNSTKRWSYFKFAFIYRVVCDSWQNCSSLVTKYVTDGEWIDGIRTEEWLVDGVA